MTKQYFVALDIGCIECGESSSVIGIFTNEDEAVKAINEAEKLQSVHWGGEHNYFVYVVDRLNEKKIPEY